MGVTQFFSVWEKKSLHILVYQHLQKYYFNLCINPLTKVWFNTNNIQNIPILGDIYFLNRWTCQK